MTADPRAACAGLSHLFDSTHPATHAQARTICHTCPLLQPCLRGLGPAIPLSGQSDRRAAAIRLQVRSQLLDGARAPRTPHEITPGICQERNTDARANVQHPPSLAPLAHWNAVLV